MASASSPSIIKSTNKALNQWLSRKIQSIRAPILLTLLASWLNGILLIAQAWLIALIMNTIIFQKTHQSSVQNWLLDLLLVLLGRFIFTYLSKYSAIEGAIRIKIQIRKELFEHIKALGPKWARSEQRGKLANNVVDAVETLEKYYADYIPGAVMAFLLPISILIITLPSDWISGIVMAVTAPLIPIFMILIGRGTERLNQRQWRKLSRMSSHFFDVIEGLTTLKLFNASRWEAKVVGQISEEYRRSTMAILKIAFLSSLVLEFLATVSIALIAVFIGFRLLYGKLDFFDGFFVLLLAPEFYIPLRNMGTQYHARMEAIGAAEQLIQIFNQKPIEKSIGIRPLTAPVKTITFKHVTFSYHPESVIIDQINFSISHGENIALIGPSGAGKSTIIYLILGFLKPQGGHILVNGDPLNEIADTDWLSHVAWIPQKPTIFKGTVFDNIALDNTNISDEEVYEAARKAQAHQFIMDLPHQYHSVIGEKGQGLSGGEKQRIAIARAFLKDASIVLLDEPTASLDLKTEKLVTAALRQLGKNRLMITIAHRLETIRNADRILVINRGRLIEQGTPQDLLSQSSDIEKLFRLYQGGAA